MQYTPTTSLTYDNRTQNLQAWAKEVGISSGTLGGRLRSGWPLEKALTTPVRNMEKTIDVDGVVFEFKQAAQLLGISPQAIYKAAKKNKHTAADEIRARFEQNPHLKP